MSNLLHNISMKPNFLCHGSRFDKDRVICSYEKPSSSEQTSPVDPVLVHNTQSSVELTTHLTLSRKRNLGWPSTKQWATAKESASEITLTISNVISLSSGEYLQPFNSHEWLRQNFSLQYQYNINQTSDENKGKILFGCNQLIQY